MHSMPFLYSLFYLLSSPASPASPLSYEPLSSFRYVRDRPQWPKYPDPGYFHLYEEIAEYIRHQALAADWICSRSRSRCVAISPTRHRLRMRFFGSTEISPPRAVTLTPA
ncbi:hypothetical protein [Planktothricoides sp. SR001]|uniref:hypothetical protein n=1 Tax=Planktothricoides sp. SR001 TaxID=1705388 RepID=UPI0018D17BBF|nr:hypothetical protein [Planktothricoides sp. SR001]